MTGRKRSSILESGTGEQAEGKSVSCEKGHESAAGPAGFPGPFVLKIRSPVGCHQKAERQAENRKGFTAEEEKKGFMTDMKRGKLLCREYEYDRCESLLRGRGCFSCGKTPKEQGND